MIKKIVIDGNDGSGKTFRCDELKKLFPDIEIVDIGLFSEATLDDWLFVEYATKGEHGWRCKDFISKVDAEPETLFIILMTKPEIAQKRIIERGDSIEEEYHTLDDLNKYNQRFEFLCELVKDRTNVMVVHT
jgi:thymidylate kinase